MIIITPNCLITIYIFKNQYCTLLIALTKHSLCIEQDSQIFAFSCIIIIMHHIQITTLQPTLSKYKQLALRAVCVLVEIIHMHVYTGKGF